MSFAARLRASLTVVRLLPAQRRIPYLPAEETAELRDARVREIVRYAAETVPYYRDLFVGEGVVTQHEALGTPGRKHLPVIPLRS